MTGDFTTYTIRTLAQGGQTASSMSVICASDRDAQLIAQVLNRPFGLEIWAADRLVSTFPAASRAA